VPLRALRGANPRCNLGGVTAVAGQHDTIAVLLKKLLQLAANFRLLTPLLRAIAGAKSRPCGQTAAQKTERKFR
jgi:hypothetical protein